MVRTLLDTCTLIWWLEGGERLPARIRDHIADPEAAVHISAINMWEISIKRAAGKLDAPDDFYAAIVPGDFILLPVTWNQADRAGSLPPHHADPFDRMLIAQAQLDELTLLTPDPRIARYDLPVVWH